MVSPVRGRMKRWKKHPDSGDGSHPEDIILISRTIETVAAILAASNEIAEVAATEDNHVAEPLRRVSELSESLWTEIKSHPVGVFPSIYNYIEGFSSEKSSSPCKTGCNHISRVVVCYTFRLWRLIVIFEM
ncbi:hypothetical protein BYT27DRAFT_7192986 [Phlegmacium glaucopus]|nr:hypothetical protein BYT27DRAFT_7192986 [Phlegmacium glaucopus]